MTLTSSQQKQLQSLFNKGMEHAARAFSQMMNTHISHDPVNVFLTSQDVRVYPVYKKQTDLVALLTTMVGDLTGKSFLVLDEHDIQWMVNKSPIPLTKGLLEEALLKETDNILSAAMITELANALSIQIFGDVPHMMPVSVTSVNELIHGYTPNGQLSIVCQSTLRSTEHKNFAPQFIWKFSHKIVTQVQAQQV